METTEIILYRIPKHFQKIPNRPLDPSGSVDAPAASLSAYPTRPKIRRFHEDPLQAEDLRIPLYGSGWANFGASST
jgi:hypothetical protein